MNPNVLEHLGLTPGESKVYLALLQLGPSSAGPIIEKSGLQNSVVHLCLNTLKDKGLISYVRKGRARIYQAADPENFLLLLEEKKKAFAKELPKLKQLQKAAKPKQTAELFEGLKGMTSMMNQLISDVTPGDTFYFFATDVEFYTKEAQLFFERYDAKRHAKGLVIKGIASKRMEELLHKRPIQMKYADFPVPSGIAFCSDKMALFDWGEKPTGVLIMSHQLVVKQQAFFEALWERL